MRITFQRQGGLAFFPALSQPVVIDTAQLEAAPRAALERLVQAVDFFALPATVGRKRQDAADTREYTVTVEEAGRSATVRVLEPFDNADVEALIAALEAHARAHRP